LNFTGKNHKRLAAIVQNHRPGVFLSKFNGSFRKAFGDQHPLNTSTRDDGAHHRQRTERVEAPMPE
jgi:hypothetical protein